MCFTVSDDLCGDMWHIHVYHMIKWYLPYISSWYYKYSHWALNEKWYTTIVVYRDTTFTDEQEPSDVCKQIKWRPFLIYCKICRIKCYLLYLNNISLFGRIDHMINRSSYGWMSLIPVISLMNWKKSLVPDITQFTRDITGIKHSPIW